MMKFLFCRMGEPTTPSWNFQNLAWETDNPKHKTMWNWFCGPTGSDTENETVGTSELLQDLQAECELTRVNAAYRLGQVGESAETTLTDELILEAERLRDQNLEQSYTNPSQLYTGYALSAIGAKAVPKLLTIIGHKNWWIRSAAADILGDIGSSAQQAIPQLINMLQDNNEWGRETQRKH